jgi:broad specificity phosphatase PhoE
VEAIREQGREAWQKFVDDPIAWFGGDGEVFRCETLAGWAAICALPGTTVAFSHGFPINIALAHCLGLAKISHFAPEYASITRLVGKDFATLRVLSVNETAHLRA